MRLPKVKGVPLTNEELAKWIDKETSKVIERLPSLKEELATYDDRTSEIYNIDASELRLMSQVHQKNIEQGREDESIERFVEQLEKYGEMNIEELAEDLTEKRLSSFLDMLDDESNITGQDFNEKEYAEELLNKLTPQQRRAFTKSKFFWDGSIYPPSEGLVKFYEEYGISPAVANLENYVKLHGYDTRNIFVDSNTRHGRGRPRLHRRRREKNRK